MDKATTLLQDNNTIIYVHFGSEHFESERFNSIQNVIFRPKPVGGTRLWASRENEPDGWEPWCRGNDYNVDKLNVYFRFTMPDAHILTISEPADLIPLPKLHPWEYTEPQPDDIPDFDLVNGVYVPSWCYLDFEKLSENYDAIELRNCQSFSYILAGWDCNCLLVLNPDKVAEIS